MGFIKHISNMFITGSHAYPASDDIKHCDGILKVSKRRTTKKRISNKNDFIWISLQKSI